MFLGGGGVGERYSGERCKEGRGFQKPRAFWSAVQCLGNQTADQKNSRKSHCRSQSLRSVRSAVGS